MRKRNILITGAGFENQGAYLMLVAVAHEVRTRFNAVPIISYVAGSDASKRETGLYSLWPAKLAPSVERAARSTAGRRLAAKLPFVSRDDVSAVFDASGFAFGDQWSTADLGARASEFESWRRRNVPVYLLPQAFGPFEKVAHSAERAVAASRVTFARDRESLDYVRALPGVLDARVESFPDFTGSVAGRIRAGDERFSGGGAIVPNANIWNRADSDATRTRYVENLAAIAERLREFGVTPYGLAHAGGGDRDLLRKLSALLGWQDFEVVVGLDGTELKGLLSTARFVASGRFHASISAMHSGVPTLVHGWSHKYRELCMEWGVPDVQVDPYADTDSSRERVTAILESESLRSQLHTSSVRIKDQSNAMWQLIEDDLDV